MEARAKRTLGRRDATTLPPPSPLLVVVVGAVVVALVIVLVFVFVVRVDKEQAPPTPGIDPKLVAASIEANTKAVKEKKERVRLLQKVYSWAVAHPPALGRDDDEGSDHDDSRFIGSAEQASARADGAHRVVLLKEMQARTLHRGRLDVVRRDDATGDASMLILKVVAPRLQRYTLLNS